MGLNSEYGKLLWVHHGCNSLNRSGLEACCSEICGQEISNRRILAKAALMLAMICNGS